MDIQLVQANFVDGRFTQEYSTNKKATFIVVKESFAGNNDLGEVDRVNIFIATYDSEGAKVSGSFSTSIIDVGDNLAGVLSDDSTILGTLLTWDNMAQCVIRLYEQ